MKRKLMVILTVSSILALCVAGCAPTRLETDFGTSFQLQKFNQTLNPEAEKNLSPVVGLRGEAANKAVEKYYKGFETETKPATSYQFNIGDITSGQ